MKQTIVGVFDRYAAAQRAARDLADSGFGPDAVHITEEGSALLDDGAPRPGTTTATASTTGTGVTGHIRSFFAELFGNETDRDVGVYSEAVRRGGAVVKVDVMQEAAVDTVVQTLERAGAIDIDEHSKSWQADGWNDDVGTPAVVGATPAMGQTSTTPGRNLDRTAGATDAVIPVVEETLQVGKRTVRTGGVRVYAHTVETPVSESVELRSEHAQVDRRPVDRIATAADLAALKDRTIEVVETAERAVVAKEARVVEEVSVGKIVDQHTEQVQDTVRHTEVRVEHLADIDDASDAAFRSDYAQRYGNIGGAYEDYAPAYQYGQGLQTETRYAGQSWNQIEPGARREWEAKHPDSAWERVKEAVRHGWSRVTS